MRIYRDRVFVKFLTVTKTQSLFFVNFVCF